MGEETVKSVPESLADLGKIYEERNKLYGDNYKHFGSFMKGLFPKTLVIQSEEDWSRLALLLHCATKLSRYAENFKQGGHADSCDDMAVYAQMLKEYDELCKQ